MRDWVSSAARVHSEVLESKLASLQESLAALEAKVDEAVNKAEGAAVSALDVLAQKIHDKYVAEHAAPAEPPAAPAATEDPRPAHWPANITP